MSRKKLSRDEREAACLLAIKRGTKWLVPEHLRDKPAKEIIAAVDYHHNVPHAITGDNRPQNLVPMIRGDHRRETAEVTIPAIAKSKRIEKKQAAFRDRILAKSGQSHADSVVKSASKPTPKLRGRPFQKMPDGVKKDWKTGKPVRKGVPR